MICPRLAPHERPSVRVFGRSQNYLRNTGPSGVSARPVLHVAKVQSVEPQRLQTDKLGRLMNELPMRTYAEMILRDTVMAGYSQLDSKFGGLALGRQVIQGAVGRTERA